MKPAIRVEDLSKLYRLGRQQSGPYRTIRETLVDAVAVPWQRLRRLADRRNRQDEAVEHWALKDVSFDVMPGDVVGIIGRNGAGKSTLLKILSRITEPTAGRAALRGRISSLLEVGTGFHPELTGRENVYMNGSILGMRRREIDRAFDDIVAFAEIEQFLDTPVKRYSSGMYVRLAFAVAAHLQSEILIVDEVLAVGDVEFQKKCLGKMQEIGSRGRTVLFVSHNMAALQSLCRRGVLLRDGSVAADCPIREAVAAYLRGMEQQAATNLAERRDRHGAGRVRLMNMHIALGPGSPQSVLITGSPAEFEFEFSSVPYDADVSFTIFDQRGTPVTNLDSWRKGPQDQIDVTLGKRVVCRLGELPLRAGRYRINTIVMRNHELEDQVEGAAFFDVEPGPYRGRILPYASTPGVICVDHVWTVSSHPRNSSGTFGAGSDH
jgi:lipopolysaccharide transport system ATP-binding protein